MANAIKSIFIMKRVLLTAALCLAVSASFAQKKVVKQAQGMVKGSNVEAAAFDEARTLIQGAMENEEGSSVRQ